jgi:hypothetical protein
MAASRRAFVSSVTAFLLRESDGAILAADFQNSDDRKSQQAVLRANTQKSGA